MEDGSGAGGRMHEAMCTGARKAGGGQESREGVGRSRGIGSRHCWEVGTEETNEINALREPAAGWGQDSWFALPCLPGGGGG